MTGVPITFGGYHSTSLPPRHPLSLWSHIAVVDVPGIPIVVDRDCPKNLIYFVSTKGLVKL